MVKIKSVSIKNFISVKEAYIEFDELGLCLVQGINGSGKSNTYRKSVTYGLYGIIPEKIKSDDYLPDFDPKNLSIVIQLKVGDKDVQIERYRKHEEFGNKVRLFINNKDISLTDNRETQKRINQLLGVDYTTFINSTAFSPNVVMFAEATPSNRGLLLGDILGLYIYKEAHNNIKEEIATNRSSLSLESSKLESLSDAINRDKDILDKLYSTRDTENRHRITKLNEILEEIKDLELELKEVEPESSLKDQLANVEEQESRLKNEHEGLLLYKDETIAKLSTVKANIFLEEKNLRSLNLKSGSKCPTCKQKISGDILDKERNEILKKLEGHRTEESKLIELKHVNDTKIKSNNREQNELSTKERDLLDRTHVSKNISNRVVELEKVASELKIPDTRTDDTIETLETSIDENENEYSKTKSSIEKIEDDLIYLEFWKKGFSKSGIPNLLIEQSLNRIQESVNTYLSGTGIVVELLGQKQLKSGEFREEIDIVIHVFGKKRTYEQLSSGEKKRVDIAFTFAILDLSNNKFNVLILDEIFDRSLDTEGCELVMEILNRKVGDLDSLITISHRPELAEQFDNVICLEV